MFITSEVDIEITNKEICKLIEQHDTDEICDILLHYKNVNFRSSQTNMVFERIVSDFKEDAVELIKKFVKYDPRYTDGMSATDVDNLIENFDDYIDNNF